MLSGQITIVTMPHEPKQQIAPGEFVVIGRGSQSDVVVDDKAVSKAHCKIFYQDGTYKLQDLKSSNFTFLNDKKVEEIVGLKDGDVIKLGRTRIVFNRVKIRDETAPLVVQEIDSSKREITLRPQSPKQKQEEDLFAQLVLPLLRPQISREALDRLGQTCPGKSLKDVLVSKGYLDKKSMESVETTLRQLSAQDKEPIAEEEPFQEDDKEERLFLKLAQSKGYLTQEQTQAVLLLQKQYARKGEKFELSQVLLKEGYLSLAQVSSLKANLGQNIPYHIEGYTLISLIGIGGMGSVYKARQISMDRLVAIKILSDEYRNNEYLNTLFLKEARAVAKLNHENIIAGYDFGEANGISYFVMEYVDGPSLQRKLKESGGRLSIPSALSIALQVARALEHAWQKGLVHRDIKPENILLTSSGIVKLCDLGLAQRIDQGSPKRQKDFGTPAYMSPEQIRGEADIDIRSDIYSLGVALYRMVFGVLPFTGGAREVMAKHLSEKLKFPSETMNKPKIELARIVSKMMAKTRTERFQSPSELLKALINLQKQIEKTDLEGTVEVSLSQTAPSRIKMIPRRTMAFKNIKANRGKKK